MSTTEPATRASVLIIGAGFGGLAAALELARAGRDDFTLLEASDSIGGVWRENTYPGCGCDVPSPLYSFSFEPNPTWPMRFSLREDIHAYMRRVASKYGIDRRIRFNTAATGAAYDDERGLWRVETRTGEVFEATVLVPAVGQLSRPAWPSIPGQDTFGGTAFHSARWDHDCELDGKRVAVIGTGASAIQFVPQIQPQARHLTVFQRSAPYIIPKPDRVYTALHHTLFRRLPFLQAAERLLCWSFFELVTTGLIGNKPIASMFGALARWHRRRQVPDPDLLAKLTPDYPVGCKRGLLSNDYYPALAEPNVTVETERVSEITPNGVRTADGTEHAADVLIYGTGFTATDFLAPLKITGSGGAELSQVWQNGAYAYLGMAVPHFPNMFLMYGPNTNLGSGSIIYMLERQARYIREAVTYLDTSEASALDVREDTAHRFDAEMQRRLERSAWAMCESWYRDANGRIATNWPGLVSEYDRRTKRLDLDAYRIR
ncbi:NAD(P)/FAD-dependent oxidoreductase [Haloechinothrix sp. YIM 98757]|uniref:NAD(P)/FAD-dependent oxidoreductase n=1 Tax=Haloechinothrix aidingensis TaxID=2752311 RepID=A0A838A8V5_9PSEU|nr:NAD(P)/FAD-dependent oxidoreductase [Haloechinothrix aidingensis]MBA0125257.1 NAD(P)/FAD-dependent oxidoreductase [Haloechinothrix aidingensis]